MSSRLKYVKRATGPVVAVPLELETDGFTYEKWGSVQRCKAGDWVVNNGGDIYTVDRQTFERTYRQVGAGTYAKATPVWAEVAREPGCVSTGARLRLNEGRRDALSRGDYLVFIEEHAGDAYAVSAEKFEAMYERAE